MTKFDDLHQKWMKNPAYAAEYAASASEFELGEALVNARVGRKMTQKDVAGRMRTTQSAISRLESGRQDATIATLRAYAEATGNELVIEFRPRRGDAGGGENERMEETPT